MKRVTFVKDLVLQELALRGDNIRYHVTEASPRATYVDSAALAMETTQIRAETVPVHRVTEVRGGMPKDIFIAYSKEVQDFLEMPFDVLRKENELLDDQCRHLRHLLCSVETASFWERLVYLFTSEIPGV